MVKAIFCIKQTDFIALCASSRFWMVSGQMFFSSFKIVNALSFCPHSCPTHGHTHSVQLVIYLTSVANNGTCLRSRITLLPSSAPHHPFQWCRLNPECTRSVWWNGGFGHALTTLKPDVPRAWLSWVYNRALSLKVKMQTRRRCVKEKNHQRET